MPLDDEKKLLLQELRIDRGQRDQYSETRSGRGPWILAGVLLLVVLLGGAGAWYYVSQGKKIEVETATAVAPSANPGSTAILQATGYVTPRRIATVSAQITGALTQVLIEEGEHVKAGQVLAHLDDTAARAALAQSQAGVAAAQAALVNIEANLGQARRDLVRNEDLVERKLVSQQALETARTNVEMLEAQGHAQERQIDLSQAAMHGAQVQLDYTTVRAPFDGVITAKSAQPGEIVSPMSAGGGFTRTGVGTIVDMDSLEIEVDVNEAYINRVTADQPAQATLDAYPDWSIPAHVIAIIPTADRSKATVKVRVAIDQKDARILPDMGVRVSFESPKSAGGPPPKGVLIPATSIVQRGDKSVVFAIDGDHVHAHAVTAGLTFGDLKLVQEVDSGTQIVRTPPAELSDGARIVLKQE